LVTDNLNIHSPASLYERFEPAQAQRITGKSSGTTRPSTAVGSTWPRSNFPC
jgi:hypothetical protein